MSFRDVVPRLLKALRDNNDNDNDNGQLTVLSVRAPRRDEWSIHFDWSDVNSVRVCNGFKAIAWVDYRFGGGGVIVCWVRRDDSRLFIHAPVTRTLDEFASMLLSSPWDEWTDGLAPCGYPYADRAAARAHTVGAKEAVHACAMALHPRLGADSALALLLPDDLIGMVICALYDY